MMSDDWEARETPSAGPPRPLNQRYPAVAGTLLWDVMKLYLADRGLDSVLAERNGWYPSEAANPDYASDGIARLVIPALSHVEGNVFWQARDMTELDPKRYTSPGAPRRDAVIVVWPAVSSSRAATRSAVLEGPMDALAAAMEGYLGVALMGMMPSVEVLSLTMELIHGTMCTIVADSDGILEMTKNVLLPLVAARCNVRLVEPSPYKDLAEATPGQRRRILA
jgi:hypothetical protein